MKLSDTDKMPFGRFKGRMMQDVPASYLHWLWNQEEFVKKGGDVCDYIEANLVALKKEYADGVWDAPIRSGTVVPDKKPPF